MTDPEPLESAALPPGIRSRFAPDINGLRIHILEAGYEANGRPLVLLLHGFPELAYSWRKVILPLATAGFHAIAPDLRGYGRTTGWDGDYDGDLASFRLLNAVRDAVGLVSAFGYREVALVAGHDFGASVAAWCALVRPDVFRSLALMSAPFAGPPALPFDTANNPPHHASPEVNIHDELAKLDRPRKHYQWYYSTRPANADMHNCQQGVHAFLRGYFHYKSANWTDNKPFRLMAWTASELAKMPTYYIMDLHKNMAETVEAEMPSPAQIAACRWLPEAELAVYTAEYERTGFQGGLQWYRRLGHAEAAAMGLTSLTALWAVEDTAQLRPGETILIQGGAGGVAGFAIQLSKHLGANVITTASARNHDYVRSLGADRVIDYNVEDFATVVSGCDVVFDTVGGDVQVRSYAVLKPGGRLVWIAPAPAGFEPTRKDVEVLRPGVARGRAHLERMLALYDKGAVWPPAITRYKLADAAEAHRVSEGRHLQGKLVLTVH